MRLENCNTDFNAVSIAPFIHGQAEEEWNEALKSAAIPKSLYELYLRSNYLSYGRGPTFLKDGESLLFSYYCMVVRSMMEALTDVESQLPLFVYHQNLTYDPIKRSRGQAWSGDANVKARRHFRDILISLQTALDALADLTALLLTDSIPNLSVGRAQFASVENWLERPLPLTGIVLSPYDHHVTTFHKRLKPLVHTSGPDRDWLPLMRLLRNKTAHLGQPVFREVGLSDHKGSQVYVFLPRKWPYIWEQHFRPAGDRSPKLNMPEMLRTDLMHQDIISFAKGLRSKVCQVIDSGLTTLTEAYISFADFPSNEKALEQLKSNSKAYLFERFEDEPPLAK